MALAVPRMSGVTQTAKESAHEANKRTLMSAASMWNAQNPTGSTTWCKSQNANQWGAYLQDWPDNPLGSGDYTVAFDPNGNITITP